MFEEADLYDGEDHELSVNSSFEPEEVSNFDRARYDIDNDKNEEMLNFYRQNAEGNRLNLFAERGLGQRGSTSTNNNYIYRGVRQILDEDDAHDLV